METVTETAGVAKRKVTAMKTIVKKKTAAPTADGKRVYLADLAKGAGIDAAKARRILRTTKIKNPGRWAWDKSDKDTIKAVQSALARKE